MDGTHELEAGMASSCTSSGYLETL